MYTDVEAPVGPAVRPRSSVTRALPWMLALLLGGAMLALRRPWGTEVVERAEPMRFTVSFGPDDGFGATVALSADGERIATRASAGNGGTPAAFCDAALPRCAADAAARYRRRL